MRAIKLLTVAICVGAVVLGGCSRGDDDSSEPADATTGEPGTAATSIGDTGTGGSDPAAATVPETSPGTDSADIEPGDLAPVCRDTALASAPAYAPTPGLHPVYVLATDEATRAESGSELPLGWGADELAPSDAQLVACVTQTATTPTLLCPGYVDDDTGTEWSVQVHDASFEVSVRVAATAEVLTSTTFDITGNTCPMFSSYTEGDPNPVPEYPLVTSDHLEPIVKPHVTGGASAAELLAASPTVPAAELTDDEFDQVCRDTGQASAPEFVAGPGVHPALLLASDGVSFGLMSTTLPEGWTAATPGDAQLVICSVLTAATSNQLCDGYTDDAGEPLQVETFDSTYDVTVRVARTAEVLHSEQVVVPGTECPMFMTFTGVEGPEPYYPEIDPVTLETLAKPFVNP
jgi:hypothetical protein